jgi:hypothetical protein
MLGLVTNKDQVSDRMIQFTLTELDSSYAGIRVYFAHFDMQTEATMEVFKINYVFSYGDFIVIVINHRSRRCFFEVDSL